MTAPQATTALKRGLSGPTCPPRLRPLAFRSIMLLVLLMAPAQARADSEGGMSEGFGNLGVGFLLLITGVSSGLSALAILGSVGAISDGEVSPESPLAVPFAFGGTSLALGTLFAVKDDWDHQTVGYVGVGTGLVTLALGIWVATLPEKAPRTYGVQPGIDVDMAGHVTPLVMFGPITF